jgi:hypothetical protein
MFTRTRYLSPTLQKSEDLRSCSWVRSARFAAKQLERLVVAPSLIPKKHDDRIKTDRCDAVGYIRLVMRLQALNALTCS